MNRIASLLVAGLLGLTSAVAANAVVPTPAPDGPQTRESAFVRSSAVTPVMVICPSATSALVQMNAQQVAYRTYRYITIVNGKTTHVGYVRASSTGVVSARTGVVNLRTSTVAMRLNDRLVVSSSVTPRCGQTVYPAGYVSAPPASGARGNASAYSLHKSPNGMVTRWNPCDGAIRFRVNPTGGGSYALQDTLAAVKSLSAATGLRFAYEGTTSFIPRSTNSGSYPAPLVISWASRSQTDLLGTGAIGEGGWRSSGSTTDGLTWTWKITKGFVIVDTGARLTPGFARGVSRGALLMHELAHAMGLGHTGDSLQVMYGTLNSSSYASWGSGDKNGLTAVGASKGCVTAR